MLRLDASSEHDWPHPPVYSRFSVQLGKMLDTKKVNAAQLRPYLRNVDVQWGKVNIENLPEMDFNKEEQGKYEIRKGDILICEGGEIGRTAIWKDQLDNCYFQKAIHRLRPLDINADDPRFFAYVMRAAVDAGIFRAFGTGSATIDHLPAERLRNFRYPSPPLQIQVRVADFLDRQTAHIDALIAEKERMLTLLEEKRVALISQAVTRGLDPDVPLKPSGLDWLGDIPVHWRIERLKFHLNDIEQGWSPQCDNYQAELEEWGVLKVGSVNSWIFDPTENKRLPDDTDPLTEYQIRQGDVLMSRANTTQLLGSVAYVPKVKGRLLLCDKLYRLKVADESLNREFLVAFLRSQPGRFQLERDATGTSGSMQNIGQDTVRNCWIVVPPIKEQEEIAKHISEILFDTENIERNLKGSILLLGERRFALITAAVTGQIDPQEMAA